MSEETARQAYDRRHGGKPDGPDIGELPEIGGNVHPVEDEKLFRKFLWSHVRLARSHAKDIPLKPRKRLPPVEEADLRWNLEMVIYQARYALAYLRRRDVSDGMERLPKGIGERLHKKNGNCWHKSAVYACEECGDGNLCDVCHDHHEPRGDCVSCDVCPICTNEEPGEDSDE